jgi:GTP cyclohydrolase II
MRIVMEWDLFDKPTASVSTPAGTLRVTAVNVHGETLLVALSEEVPDIPVVRFQSSCVFGESFYSGDCDCGGQLRAAIDLICAQGGILVYAWEEGRGVGIVAKLRAIAMQQTKGLSTADAFRALGYSPDPRTFDAPIAALKQVFEGKHIRLASSNPRKVVALERAGFTVERVKLDIPMTPKLKSYLKHQQEHLGHLHDD